MVGLLNIHKPSGMTSRRVVDIVARLAGTKRVGHAGTLDPLAEGVLVVCLGWATRLVSFVQERRKIYRARFLLGQRSDTDDVTGEVVAVVDAQPPDRPTVEAALCEFRGQIMQVPPQFSAVHVAGRRAHTLARSGKAVQLEARPVEVHRLDLIKYDFPNLELEIECGSGTYIRSIGRDLGTVLGCGAVMCSLVRSAIGEFRLDSAVRANDLVSHSIAAFLLPPLAAVAHLPRWSITSADLDLLLRGLPLSAPSPKDWPPGSLVSLVNNQDKLQSLAEYDAESGLLRPRQVFGVEAQ